MKPEKFEDLEAWKAARELVRKIYEICRRPPLSKDFGMRDQLQRAAVSVMNNIAEGFERFNKAEKPQFYNIGRGSCGEVGSLLYAALDQEYLSEDEFNERKNLAIRTGKLTTGLHNSVSVQRPPSPNFNLPSPPSQTATSP